MGMWIGASAVTGAISVDAYQVLGIRSLLTMTVATLVVLVVSVFLYRSMSSQVDEHLGSAANAAFDSKRTVSYKAFCEAKDAELNNNTLVAALIFTVASQGVLDPTQANITGSHTDLYGALSVLALILCLNCVLFGAIVKSQLAKVVRSANEQSYAFCGVLEKDLLHGVADHRVHVGWDRHGICGDM